MLFYYVHDLYQKNQLQTRLDKRPDNHRKSKHSKRQQGWRVWEGLGVGGALSSLRKFPGFNEQLDWLKIDLNATKIICRVKV